MGQLELARLTPDRWRAYRAIRLAALAEAPFAFSSILAEERQLRESDWRSRLAGRAQFVVRTRRRSVGTAAGVINTNDDDTDGGAELVSLWVHPAYRGQGVGDLLVQAVVGWAREQGHPEILLWVSAENGPAERLYARHGFVRTGQSQPVRPTEPLRQEFAMRRFLSTTPDARGQGQ